MLAVQCSAAYLQLCDRAGAGPKPSGKSNAAIRRRAAAVGRIDHGPGDSTWQHSHHSSHLHSSRLLQDVLLGWYLHLCCSRPHTMCHRAVCPLQSDSWSVCGVLATDCCCLLLVAAAAAAELCLVSAGLMCLCCSTQQRCVRQPLTVCSMPPWPQLPDTAHSRLNPWRHAAGCQGAALHCRSCFQTFSVAAAAGWYPQHVQFASSCCLASWCR
jgi:hypothetical protein